MSWSCEPYTDEDLNYSDDDSRVSHNTSMKDCEMWNWRLIPDDWQEGMRFRSSDSDEEVVAWLGDLEQ